MSRALAAGDRVVLVDSRGRRYLIRLQDGERFHYHGGIVDHDALIGGPDGSTIRTQSGATLAVFRPRLADFVLKMGRGAQVVYPKDIASILVEGDIFPGAHVIEAGTGSASLTIALARAVGESGRVVSYELREEHLDVARKNLASFFGSVPAWVDLRAGDVRDAADETFDRMVLDLPEPWRVLPVAELTLATGGVLAAYLPTTGQLQQLVLSLEHAAFAEIRSFETMVRGWHVSPRSVRPDHRMVGHTGFVVTARRVAPSGSGG